MISCCNETMRRRRHRLDEYALGCVFTSGLQFDNAEKRVLRLASIYPRSSVSCAAVTLRTRFIGCR